jgi:cell division protein FtsI (penicillin-binding protein 3)
VYPYRELAAPLVGFANIDGRGVRGIEQGQDEWLRGTPRQLPMERDGSGDLLIAHGDELWHTAGGDVALTVDVAMQSDARLALREAVEQTGARGGVVVTLDPASGDVLALAEAPGFDPNRFRELDYAETRSRAFLDALEPGSTLKAFLVAAALEQGAITPDDWIDCEEGAFPVPGKTIRDLKPHGALRSADILTVSSNIGAVKIAFALGAEAHVEMLRRFGFGSVTGSGFPDESSGLLREASAFRPLDHATLAFGQGLSATPIQLAAATAALANGGVWRRPRLVAARRGAGGPDGRSHSAWEVLEPDPGRRVVSPRTAASLLEMLEGVTGPEGTGRRAGLRGMRVAGKTGTAQKLDLDSGTYSDSRFVSWFIGVVPADAPRLAIAVALDEPRRPAHTGGASAAPLFARVAAAQLARLGILTEPEPTAAPLLRTAAAETVSSPGTSAQNPPEQNAKTARAEAVRTAAAPARTMETASGETARTAKPAAGLARADAPPPLPELESLAGRVLLPDLRGLTADQVRVVTERANLVLEISGSGRAVAQEPPPGSIVAAQGRVRVVCRPGVDPT